MQFIKEKIDYNKEYNRNKEEDNSKENKPKMVCTK